MGICTILVASQLVLATPAGGNPHTVHYFDRHINVTNRVLNRSICKDLERTQAADARALGAAGDNDVLKEQIRIRARLNGRRNAAAMETHCSARLRADDVGNGEDCYLLKR